jgi:hypothetical protein
MMSTRRKLIKGSLIALGGSVLPFGVRSSVASSEAAPYLDELSAPKAAPAKGTRYEDHVPDTLDIAERAKLGIHCMAGIADRNAGFEIFWFADFHRNPPVMIHDFNDWCYNVEGLLESLALLHGAIGADEASREVENAWQRTLLESVGPDGLIYASLARFPWNRIGTGDSKPIWKADGTTTHATDKSVKQITCPSLWPRAIATMTVYYLRDRNPVWKSTIERMIDRMSEIATLQGDYAFFPAGAYEPNVRFSDGGYLAAPLGFLAIDHGEGRLIQGLAQYYRASGYESARKLAEKLVNFLRSHSDYYDSQGRFLTSAFEIRYLDPKWYLKYSQDYGGDVRLEQLKDLRLGGHFHNHTIGLLGVLEYAVVVRDHELLEWCKQSFEWARSQGSPLVGFFPEFIVPGYPSCESCGVADMISLAAKLTDAGLGDYWDDIDRWMRNQFAENQLTDAEWISFFSGTLAKQPVAFNETSEDVAHRNLGGYAGWASANEWALKDGIMHCCTGNSTRALYYIWQRVTELKGETLQVNLLLNHASPWADLYSSIPYKGKVDFIVKKSFHDVLVRAPEWVMTGSQELVCTVNGGMRQLRWEGRYVSVGTVKNGDRIALTFPIEQRTIKKTIGTGSYTLVVRGNTVISIDPAGKTGPLYTDRQRYLAEDVSWRKVTRFVPDEVLPW